MLRTRYALDYSDMFSSLQTRGFSSCIAAVAAYLVLGAAQAADLAALGSVRFDQCRGVTCDAAYAPNAVSAVVEIRGASPRDAGRLLDLNVYDAATHEIAHYDVAEVSPVGDFVFRVALDSLRPGSYTFTVAPRYSRALVGSGVLRAVPSLVPVAPAWRVHGSSEQSRP